LGFAVGFACAFAFGRAPLAAFARAFAPGRGLAFFAFPFDLRAALVLFFFFTVRSRRIPTAPYGCTPSRRRKKIPRRKVRVAVETC
jgi:hypothetical protein